MTHYQAWPNHMCHEQLLGELSCGWLTFNVSQEFLVSVDDHKLLQRVLEWSVLPLPTFIQMSLSPSRHAVFMQRQHLGPDKFSAYGLCTTPFTCSTPGRLSNFNVNNANSSSATSASCYAHIHCVGMANRQMFMQQFVCTDDCEGGTRPLRSCFFLTTALLLEFYKARGQLPVMS